MTHIKRVAYTVIWRILAFLGISRLDYYRHYARHDLQEKYKVLPGCESEKEFDETGERALALLKSLELKPHSRILDLGCGTGRLTTQLLDFLDQKGEYFGCDISPHVIEFCRERYVRPNFHFYANKMTEIPLHYEKYFDFIWCYSVFTHVYPHEMLALLRECRRLLRPRGLMLASFYIAGREPALLKSVRTSYGNRDRIEYGEDYLRRILTDQDVHVSEVKPILKQPILVLRFVSTDNDCSTRDS